MSHPELVAILQEKREAIDSTPIYYIRLLRKLEKNTILRFDVTDFKIYEE